MKTFLRKVKLSLLAMLCGWLACNIAWWAGAIPSLNIYAAQLSDPRVTLLFVFIVGFYSVLVVLMAWLVIFLPVDLLVPDASRLRQPKTAAVFGFFSAFAILSGLFLHAAWARIVEEGLVDGVSHTWGQGALPYALGTCATGTVAAWTRAWMDKPKRNQTP